jgi:hypothetical protein
MIVRQLMLFLYPKNQNPARKPERGVHVRLAAKTLAVNHPLCAMHTRLWKTRRWAFGKKDWRVRPGPSCTKSTKRRFAQLEVIDQGGS